jgi:hypothetical protein
MRRIPLDSSAVKSAGYDDEAMELELEFRGGRVYRFRDVPKGVYDFLLRTPEKGRYVRRMISDRYAYFEVPEDPQPEPDLVTVLRASLRHVGRDGDD